ncbi:hypothetical protein NGRRMQZB_51 [Escherichia phage Dru_SM1]
MRVTKSFGTFNPLVTNEPITIRSEENEQH